MGCWLCPLLRRKPQQGTDGAYQAVKGQHPFVRERLHSLTLDGCLWDAAGGQAGASANHFAADDRLVCPVELQGGAMQKSVSAGHLESAYKGMMRRSRVPAGSPLQALFSLAVAARPLWAARIKVVGRVVCNLKAGDVQQLGKAALVVVQAGEHGGSHGAAVGGGPAVDNCVHGLGGLLADAVVVLQAGGEHPCSQQQIHPMGLGWT